MVRPSHLARISIDPHLCSVANADCRGTSSAVWGGAALVALLLIGNKIPVVKNDILKKIPLVRGYFIEQDNIPDSDKPF
jgi:Ubiquinol-cytochrome-c reductase complex subunit (QCR10)